VPRFAGIDVGSQKHVVALVDDGDNVLVKPTPFGEDAPGYEKLFRLLGSPEGLLVVMEATGHYWQNLFQELVARGFTASVVNSLRTRRFAGCNLRRAKNDALDALDIARFAAHMRPQPSEPLDSATQSLRELFQTRLRLVQDFGDRVRQLHRLVDLGFPEFTRFVKSMDSSLASAILARYPTAEFMAAASTTKLARLIYDGRHHVGRQLAEALVASAGCSVGRHHLEAFRTHVQYLCRDLDQLRAAIRVLDTRIADAVAAHPVASCLATIDGIGVNTAACIVATIGDPARFRSADAFASYAGLVPASSSSGLRNPVRSRLTRLGNSALRQALWMPNLTAVKVNPWLSPQYQRLRARGKPPKVALIASMRKLLTLIWAVAKRRTPFMPEDPARPRVG
jgi:transposase